MSAMLIESRELLAGYKAVVFDCRFSLADPLEGRSLYQQGHIAGAHYLDLNEDLAGPQAKHGGRHPLPDPIIFAATLARFGVGPNTSVVVYDDSRFAFAARLWWMMRALGYQPPRLLNGGYCGFLQAGGLPAAQLSESPSCESPAGANFSGYCDIEGLREAQSRGALLVDSRESRRYEGWEEPIDPVAGHIPGAINRPWQSVTDSRGFVWDEARLKAHWVQALDAEELVVYCGSGVTACVNLFSLALIGKHNVTLYPGSWSDWCTYF